MNVLLLMSGGDADFRAAGYAYPKNLVELEGAPLVKHVMDGLSEIRKRGVRFIYIIGKDEASTHHTDRVIRLLDPEAGVIMVNGETSGAACTAMLAIAEIARDEPLLIVNGDIVLEADLDAIVDDFSARGLDGGAVVFRDVHPRWSFMRAGSDGIVVEVAEKRPISDLATAGVYYYARGIDFVCAVSSMMLKDAHVCGRFYICPAFNEMILHGYRIGYFEVPKSAYHSLKMPHDIHAYKDILALRRRC